MLFGFCNFQVCSTAGTIIKEEISIQDAEDKQPRTEVTEVTFCLLFRSFGCIIVTIIFIYSIT